MLETRLLDLISGQTDPTLATYAKDHESTLRIASKRKTRAEAEQAVEEMLAKVRDRIGPYIYSEDDEDLSFIVLRKLLEDGIRLSVAESCTGGSFAAAVTEMPGVSAIFDRGIVTYSNEAKIQELGVKSETLQRWGAVSPQVAEEMAEGLYRVSGSDLCLSVTGIAGPGGGSDEKPVGLIYIGLWYRGQTSSFRYQLRNSNRRYIRSNAVMHMFLVLYKTLFEED
jgi:nicotinamide-nucleotide amidase